MPWTKKQNNADCPSDKPWAVVNDESGEVEGCHPDEEAADAQIAALHANVDEAEASVEEAATETFETPLDVAGPVEPTSTIEATEHGFSIPVMVIEGAWTGDSRWIDPGVLSWRDLPLPVMAITKTTQGHDDAELCAKMTGIVRKEATADGLIDPRTGAQYAEGTTYLAAEGVFDSSEWAQEIHRLVGEGFLRGVSVDLSDVTSDIVFIDKAGEEIEGVDFFDWLFGDSEEDMEDFDIGEKIRAGRVMGVTICPFPAFEGAYIEVPSLVADSYVLTPSFDNLNNDGRWPSIVNHDTPFRKPRALAASAFPVEPPSEWFADPLLSEKTPLTIESNGHIYGHMASWDECHTAFNGQCIKAPRSQTDYSYFRLGAVLCDDETLVATGPITMGTGHAELWLNADAARSHYDNTGTAMADVICGEDQFGIWFSGAMSPDADEVAIRRLRGSVLSGDWRDRGGHLELIAALAVNTPGFPVTRPIVRVASGWPQAMVAAGMVTEHTIKKQPTEAAAHRVAPESYQDKVVREALRNRVHR
jgi:hypothetical protein